MFSLAGLQKGLRSTFDMMGGSGTQKHATETSAAGVNESGEIIEESQGKKRLNILKKKAFIMFTEDENLRQYSSSNKVGDSPYAPMEPIPTSIFKKPYWQLRCIETTMKTGGFLNPDLFLPKQAWDQSHLKIAGYSAKMSAFQAILLLLNEVQLTFSEITSTSPDKIYNTVSNLVEEFRGIQNQLTQPFSFIPAVTVTNPPAEDSEEAEAQSGFRLMRFMSVFRRNVRKYTALGLSRLNAMPAVVRRSDLRALVALYCNICHACQILDTLYEHCSEWLTSLEESQLALSPRTPSVSSTLPSESANATEFTPVPRAPSTDTADGQPETPGRLSLRSSRQSTPRILSGSQKEKMLRHNISVLKATLSDLEVASQFIATVVCELILRDTQLFAIKYVRRITLGFVRTGLEDDPGHVSTRGQQSYFMGSGDDDDDQEYPESEPDADQFDEHDETHREIQFDEIEEERIKSALEEVDQSDTHMSVQSSISIDESITK